MSELIGPLGLPGALVALFGVFFLGLKIKNEITGKPTASAMAEGGYTLKDATIIAAGLTARIDLSERAIHEDIGKTRHSFGDGFEKAIERLSREMEVQTKEIVAAIEKSNRRRQ